MWSESMTALLRRGIRRECMLCIRSTAGQMLSQGGKAASGEAAESRAKDDKRGAKVI